MEKFWKIKSATLVIFLWTNYYGSSIKENCSITLCLIIAGTKNYLSEKYFRKLETLKMAI